MVHIRKATARDPDEGGVGEPLLKRGERAAHAQFLPVSVLVDKVEDKVVAFGLHVDDLAVLEHTDA